MFKKTIIAGLVAGAFGSGLAQAQAPAAPASPHTLTGNISFASQYVFRGVKQTFGDPALQGGFDYGHSSGFYLGTWASNISWLKDGDVAAGTTPLYDGGGSLEWDFYGGFKGEFGKSGFGWDVGLLYYGYPGDPAPGVAKADTVEAYGALSWKWLTAKYSYALTNLFGVPESDGSWYLDFGVDIPVNDKFSIQLHYGIQEFDGTDPATGLSWDSTNSYKDWKIGATYALPQDFTIGAYYTDTDLPPVMLRGKDLAKGTFTVFLSKTF